jgi:ubiquinone/menaquinone biosynthesis C-methylase UbiE
VAWTVSLGRWKGWVGSLLPRLKGPHVLELGHGPGHLQAGLAASGSMGFGLDRSRQMGQLARRRLERAGAVVRLVRADAVRLPFQSGCFDDLAATFPSEYILQSAVMAEAHRVLKPGGGFHILPVAWITGGCLLERLAAALFQVTGQAEGSWENLLEVAMRKTQFEVKVSQIEGNSSRLLLVQGTKPL